MKAEPLDRVSERGIGLIEQAVHFWRQPARHVPIIGLGQGTLAAPQSHPAIGDRLVRAGMQLLTDRGGRRLVLSPDAIRDDPGAIREMVA